MAHLFVDVRLEMLSSLELLTEVPAFVDDCLAVADAVVMQPKSSHEYSAQL